jgi:hypothetical protein
MWGGVELVVTNPDAAEGAITAVATDAVFDQLVRIYNPTVDGQSDLSTPRTFENNPVVAESSEGVVTIDDCLFETPRAGNRTIWYRGTATFTEGQWQIDGLEVVNHIGCVPAGIAEAAIQGYEDYWDARLVFWDPPDPDHPLVAETLVEPQLSFIRDLLVEHRDRGVALRGRQTSHPEIIEVRSATDVAILDCHDQDPERGVFDLETGERLDDIAPIDEGQRDLHSAVMLLEGGRWKVSDVQGRSKVDCDYAPTPQGLPVVG